MEINTKVCPTNENHKITLPRIPSDFGDGGAFPEIQLPQYPKGMGYQRSENNLFSRLPIILNSRSEQTSSDPMESEYNRNRYQKMNGLSLRNTTLCFGDKECDLVAKRTMKALLPKINHSAKSKVLPCEPCDPYFIKYTPIRQNSPWENGDSQRLIQVQEMTPDPIEPPRHKLTKVPRGSSCEPVPVMHSPPRTVDHNESATWKIPPALSNWKNAKGYIIPLEKRIAVDGRNLQETKINDNFAKLSEALYVAEQRAQEDMEVRNSIAKEHLIEKKERKNAEMQALALKARLAMIEGNTNTWQHYEIDKNTRSTSLGDRRYDTEERRCKRYRDEIRRHNQELRERDRRLSDAGEHGYKRSKLSRDYERDIGEKIALGLFKTSPAISQP